jgi:hypothetical protein
VHAGGLKSYEHVSDTAHHIDVNLMWPLIQPRLDGRRCGLLGFKRGR